MCRTFTLLLPTVRERVRRESPCQPPSDHSHIFIPIPETHPIIKMMLNRKTSAAGQASGTRQAVPSSVRATGSSGVKPSVVLPARGAFAPSMTVDGSSKRIIECRAAAVEAVVPSNTKQEKTTKPMNLVFVATEAS